METPSPRRLNAGAPVFECSMGQSIPRKTSDHGCVVVEGRAPDPGSGAGYFDLIIRTRLEALRSLPSDMSHILFEGDGFITTQLFASPISQMENAHIGVEASYFLYHILHESPANEPLLAALGGAPIALTQHIEDELDRWKEHKLTPVFVFEGVSSVGKDEIALSNARTCLDKTEKAWILYNQNLPNEAVQAFGAAGAVRPQELYGILQQVLSARGLEYITAPYSACAQLAYLEKLERQYIDGIMGSQELLLYDITGPAMMPPSLSDWEKKIIPGFIKSELIDKLNVTPDIFADALLMLGTSFLAPFPPLEDPTITSRQPYSIQDAVNLLRTSEKSVTSTCASFNDVLQLRHPNWLDEYRKAKMGIMHCVTKHEDGSIQVKDYDTLTSDNVEYLGIQLPAELHHYLSTALVGHRLLDCFGSLEFVVYPPLDGVLSDEYRRLVTESLAPLKTTTAALVASRIHRGFQYKSMSVKFWFDKELKVELKHRDQHIPTNAKTDTWGVKDVYLNGSTSTAPSSPGSVSFAVLALQDANFAKNTISKSANSLKSIPEISTNALWRLLHLRDYVDDEHQLTAWGKALAITLKAIQPIIKTFGSVHHVEEAAFLAFELLQFDNLNARNRHTELVGGPLRGSDEEKASCILVGRLACLLLLRHKTIGYTGPLSKNFLSFYSLIRAVRETDRDLLEAITASMLLNNQVERRRDDAEYRKLSEGLPFGTDINVGLGIAVKTYLDDYVKISSSKEERQAAKFGYATTMLPNSVNFVEDLDVAFRFFDAVYEGVTSLGDHISTADKNAWDAAKDYLELRR